MSAAVFDLMVLATIFWSPVSFIVLPPPAGSSYVSLPPDESVTSNRMKPSAKNAATETETDRTTPPPDFNKVFRGADSLLNAANHDDRQQTVLRFQQIMQWTRT